MELKELLKKVIEMDASDLHLRCGEPPILRIYGELHRLDGNPLSKTEIREMIYSILNESQQEKVERDKELDLAYTLKEAKARFRVNVFFEKGSIAAAIRSIPLNIKSIDDLELPPVLKELAEREHGFILVTGPTGSGKSTTLAAMIEHINTTKRRNIITIEDPIEFLHKDNLSCIQQRELGIDTHSFADALKYITRENPDVILVGEMRDLETIQSALTAAEMGELVFATLHTSDASQTIDRIVDVFPEEEQPRIRGQLAISLEAIISQTLLKRKDKPGRIAAMEILIVTPAVRNMIREGKAYQLYSVIQSSRNIGMQTLDQHLLELCKNQIVDYEEALSKAANPEELLMKLRAYVPSIK